MKGSLGLDGTCLLYSSISFLVILWGAYTIPDNRGKSLVNVEENIRNIMMSTMQLKDVNIIERDMINPRKNSTGTKTL